MIADFRIDTEELRRAAEQLRRAAELVEPRSAETTVRHAALASDGVYGALNSAPVQQGARVRLGHGGRTVAEAAGRSRIASALLSAVVVLLTACSPSVPGSQDGNGGADLDIAQAELLALLDEAQTIIGGDWESTLSGARPCGLDSGAGAQVSQIRGGPGVAEGTEREVASAILAVFADAGYELVTRERTSQNDKLVVEGHYPLNGKDAAGVLFQFGLSANGSSISGYSRCVPGDADAINLERNDPLKD